MPLESDADVEQIRTVQDPDGAKKSAATAEAQGAFQLGGTTYTVQAANTEEQLPDQSVPRGSLVMVFYESTNAGAVYVGPPGTVEFPLLAQGDNYSAKVGNLNEISVEAPNAGDKVHIHWEA